MEQLSSPLPSPPASPASSRKGSYGLSPALERLFLNPSLICCSFKGRVYVYSRDIVPHANEEEILRIYEQARKAAEEFRAHFNAKSQFFRQRKAQKTVIFSTHQAWKLELENHFEKFLEAQNLSGNYCKYNPLMKEPAHIEAALTLNMSLNSWTLPLVNEYRELIELLHSEQYAASLEIYKDLKKKCKLLMGKKTIEERVDELASIIKEAEDKIKLSEPKLFDKKEVVKVQSILVYIEMLIIIKYTSYMIQGKVLPSLLPKEPTEESSYQVDASPHAPEMNVNGDVPSSEKPFLNSWFSLGWLRPISSRFLTSSAAEESARSFADLPALDRERLTGQLNALVEKVILMEKRIYQKVPHETQEEDPPEADRVLASDFVNAASLQKFPSEDDFRNGQRLATAPFIGPYRDIRPQVAELTKIAKAVVKLQEIIHQLMIKLNQGSLEEHDLKSAFPECDSLLNPSLHDIQNHCRRIIEGIEMLIEVQGKALLQLPYINSVPEGLYYVANLFAKSREVRMYIDLFETMIDDNYILYPKSLAALRAYLDSIKSGSLNPEEFQGPEALMRLYQAAALASQLKKPTSAETVSQKLEAFAFPQIDEILAKVGLRTLVLSVEESKVAAGIFSRLSLEAFRDESETDVEEKNALLPVVIITALTKALMKQTLFSKRGIDPELEVKLCVLESQTDYAPAFQNTLKELPWFANLIKHYHLQSDVKDYDKECLLMGKALNFLNPKLPSSFIENAFRYCKAMQIFREIQSKKISAQHEKRIRWFKEKTAPFFTQVQKDLPEIFDETFFYPLAASLYADDSKEKREGTDLLLTRLGQCKPEELPQERTICLLLHKWVLEYSRSVEIRNIPHGHHLLSQFFENYLNDQTIRSLWRMEFCIEFLEIALKKLIELEEQNHLAEKKLIEVVREKRTMEGYEEWIEVLKFYEQFQSVFVELNELIALSSSSEEVTSKISELNNRAAFIVATAFGKVPRSLDDTVVNEFIDIEDPLSVTIFENPQTHFEIARWFCEKMKSQFAQLLFAEQKN